MNEIVTVIFENEWMIVVESDDINNIVELDFIMDLIVIIARVTINEINKFLLHMANNNIIVFEAIIYIYIICIRNYIDI